MIKRIIYAFKNRLFIKKNIIIKNGTRILTSYENFGSEPYLVEIGENCLITSGVKFLTHDGAIGVAAKVVKGQDLDETYGKLNKIGKIIVKDNCFIGVNSIIMPGVTIGPNSIIAAGSIVTKDVSPNNVVGGNPAKFICTVEEYSVNALEKSVYNSEKDLEKRKEVFLNTLKK